MNLSNTVLCRGKHGVVTSDLIQGTLSILLAIYSYGFLEFTLKILHYCSVFIIKLSSSL